MFKLHNPAECDALTVPMAGPGECFIISSCFGNSAGMCVGREASRLSTRALAGKRERSALDAFGMDDDNVATVAAAVAEPVTSGVEDDEDAPPNVESCHGCPTLLPGAALAAFACATAWTVEEEKEEETTELAGAEEGYGRPSEAAEGTGAERT